MRSEVYWVIESTIGKDLSIAYTSRLLNKTEQNYSTIEKELLAIVYSVQFFRPYIYGRKFALVTDHQPLKWLHSVKDPTSRLARWRFKLAEYEYEVVYKAGKININADALSRNPIPLLFLRREVSGKLILKIHHLFVGFYVIKFPKSASRSIADRRKLSSI